MLNFDESSDEMEKLNFICSCSMNSVEAGGSVLIPIGLLGIILQLLELFALHIESSGIKVFCFVQLLFSTDHMFLVRVQYLIFYLTSTKCSKLDKILDCVISPEASQSGLGAATVDWRAAKTADMVAMAGRGRQRDDGDDRKKLQEGRLIERQMRET
ncbi:hypothetical protein E3N88_24853 [Mikania micrantha]|uniref:Uncharacterized protein n=1 Tax=Mikania micrantha TaxID=192012 RepID=A0A5N6N336_9ASTR|nr:hypothetical protein E3N88_24853 [Mikania micrantha]